MKTLTIVPEDKTVVVDGMGFTFDFIVDPDIHAIQWDTDSGHIEYKSDKFNTTIDSIKEYDSIIAKHGEFKLEFEIEEKNNVLLPSMEYASLSTFLFNSATVTNKFSTFSFMDSSTSRVVVIILSRKS